MSAVGATTLTRRRQERSPDALASEEIRPVLRAPSGRDRTGQTKRLLGGEL